MPEGTIFQGGISPDQGNPASNSQPPLAYSSPDNAQQDDRRKSGFGPKSLIKIAVFLFFIITVIFIILVLVSPRFKTEDKEVTLLYWGIKEESTLMDSVISEFEIKNPKIKVEYSKQDAVDYREKLSTRIRSGNGPDIFKFHNTWFPMIREDLLPLSKETIDRTQFREKFYNAAQKDLVKNGAIYGIPMETDTLVLYVNSSIFTDASATPPATWQEFIDVSEKLTKRDEGGKITTAGAAMGTYENIVHAPDIISLLFAQNGIDMEKISEYPEKISDALRFYTTFALTENSVWDSTLDSSLSAFSQGKLAMFFGYYWDYFEIKSQNPNLSFKIYPVPQLLTDSKVNITSYWADGVSSQSKNQKEALLFIKFLAEEETQRKIYQGQIKLRGLGQPPGIKNLEEDLRTTESFIFANQSSSAVSSPFVDSTFDNGLNMQLGEILKEVVENALKNGSSDIDSSALIDGYTETLSKFMPQPTQ